MSIFCNTSAKLIKYATFSSLKNAALRTGKSPLWDKQINLILNKI